MGKASRRKRESAQGSPDAAEAAHTSEWPGGGRAVRRWVTAAAVATVVLVLGFWAWRLSGIGDEEPARVIELPYVDTSGMTPPVVRAIDAARRDALAGPASAGKIGRFGQVLHAHWLHEPAEQCYAAAHELAPGEFRWAYLLAGVAELRGAEGHQIDELFRNALQLAPPGFAPIHVRYADALMRLGRWSEARDHYATAVGLDPELILAHRGLGQALILLGEGQAAVEHLERAAALSPGDRIAQVALARAYALTGDEERASEASRWAEEARGSAPLPDTFFHEVERLAVAPEDLRARYRRGLQAGDIEAAAKAAGLLAESGDSTPSRQLPLVVKQHANQLAYAGDFDQALAAYEQAARLAPEDPEIEHNWGTVLLRRGELEAAAEHFERAVVLNPASADSLYNLGVVMEGLGREDEAVANFTAAVAIDPQHVAAERLSELNASIDR